VIIEGSAEEGVAVSRQQKLQANKANFSGQGKAPELDKDLKIVS
jgi:hypothetical protein